MHTRYGFGGVGVGLAEIGNKGAVGLRFKYNGAGTSTELTFVAAHLAAMEWEVKRRIEDWLLHNCRKSSSLPSAEERPLLSISIRDASIY